MSLFPTNVIVGIDGTPPSRQALEAAVELCRATGSTLHLVHVKLTSAALRGRPMTPSQRERTETEGRELLAREAATAQELGVEVAGTHLRHGQHVATTMTAAAAELQAGLLVIGDSPSGRLAHSLLASYSATTVRHAEGSVMVVR